MALSADTNRVFEVGTITTVPVKASSQIYLGSAVGFVSGYARALVAGDDFAGFALENKLGTTDGAVNCAVSPSGQVSLSISSIAVTDIGKPVYASADGTFTLTQTSNSKIGTVSRWVSTGVAIVRYEAQGAGADLTGVTVLTDSSGGAAANGTIGAVTAPTAITNSSGSAASNGTIEAVTAPTALTDNGGGTADATVEAMTPVTALTVSDGVGTNDGTIGAITGDASVIAAVQELAAKIGASATFETAAKNNFKELTTRQAENRTAIIALTDAIGEFATAQTANRTAIIALTDAVTELATKQNEVINALK